MNSRENSSVDQAHDDSSEEGSSGSSSESEDDSGDENSQVSDVELSQDAGKSGCDDKSVSSEDSACSDESIGLNLDSDDEDDEKEDDGKNSNVGIEVAPEKQVYEDGEQAGNENMGLVKRGSLCIEDLEDIINESPNESDARSDTAAVGMVSILCLQFWASSKSSGILLKECSQSFTTFFCFSLFFLFRRFLMTRLMSLPLRQKKKNPQSRLQLYMVPNGCSLRKCFLL